MTVLLSTFGAWAAFYLCIAFWLVNAQSALRGAPLSKLLSNVVYTRMGWNLEALVSAAAILAYVLFVADTYSPTTSFGVFVVQVACQTLICCEYVFQLASASNKLLHVLSASTPMHLLPLIPLISAVRADRCRIAGAYDLEPGGAWADDWPNRSLSFVYILILIRSRMVSRSLAMFLGRLILDGQQGGSTATHLYLGVVIWNLVVAVIFFAGWHLYISLMFEFNQQLDFVDAFYFTIVTIATVGYGDIYPDSPPARIFVVLFIVMVVMVFIPRLFAQLNDLFALSSKYNGSFTPRADSWHVVVSSDATCALAMRQFLDEFFHEDHRIDGQVVMLVPGDPGQSGSSDWASLLLLYGTTDQVVYLNGDAVSALDLQRARADTARMVFLLADADSRDSNTQDAKIISRAQTVRSFFESTPILVQLIEPENQEYLRALGMASRSIVCINELRMKLLAMGVACAGVPTLVSNLISSAAPPDEEIPEDGERQSSALGYRYGQAHEIYMLTLPPSLIGASFGDVALAMREELGACLFALGRASAPAGLGRRASSLSGLGSGATAATGAAELNVVLHPGSTCPLLESDVLYIVSLEPLTARELELIDERFAHAPEGGGLALPTPLKLRNLALTALGLGGGSDAPSAQPSRAGSRADSFKARAPVHAPAPPRPTASPEAPRLAASSQPPPAPSPARVDERSAPTELDHAPEALATRRVSGGAADAAGRAKTLQPSQLVRSSGSGGPRQSAPAGRAKSVVGSSRFGRPLKPSELRQQRMQAQRLVDGARGSSSNLLANPAGARGGGGGGGGVSFEADVAADELLESAARSSSPGARRKTLRKSSLAVYAMLRRNGVRFGSPIVPNARLQAENELLPPAAILASGQLQALRGLMTGHIVLITQSLDDMVIFVSGMRASHLRHRPIVIICPIAAMGSRDAFIEWAEIDQFRGVFLLQGRAETPTLDDLNNAHARHAECVVVVSSKSLRTAEKSSEQIDLENLITTLSVRAVVGDRVKCVVQLQSGNLVRNFGSPVIAETKSPARAQPSALASIKRFGTRVSANGSPVSASRRGASEGGSSPQARRAAAGTGKQFESAHATPSPSEGGFWGAPLAWLSRLGIWLGLWSDGGALEQRRRLMRLDYTLTPHFMSGMLVVTSVVGHLLCQAFFNEASVPVVNALLADDTDSAPLIRIAVPREFWRKVAAGELSGTYCELFRFLLDTHDVLALGLYRCDPDCAGDDAHRAHRRSSTAPASGGTRKLPGARTARRSSSVLPAAARRLHTGDRSPTIAKAMRQSRRDSQSNGALHEVVIGEALGGSGGDDVSEAAGALSTSLDAAAAAATVVAAAAADRADRHSVDHAHPHAPPAALVLEDVCDSLDLAGTPTREEPAPAETLPAAPPRAPPRTAAPSAGAPPSQAGGRLARASAPTARESPWQTARLALERKLLKPGVLPDDDDELDGFDDGDDEQSQPATQFVVLTNPPAHWLVRADDSVFVLLRATDCLFTPKRRRDAQPGAAPEHALEVLGQSCSHRLPNVSAFLREREAAPRLGVDEGFIDANTALIAKFRSFEHSLGEKIDKLVTSQQRGEERLAAMETDLARVTRALADLASATAASAQSQAAGSALGRATAPA